MAVNVYPNKVEVLSLNLEVLMDNHNIQYPHIQNTSVNGYFQFLVQIPVGPEALSWSYNAFNLSWWFCLYNYFWLSSTELKSSTNHSWNEDPVFNPQL